eukprot:TRINITY_DN29751_c0_g1_i1.p1 TRINITY_DN29751_c0_g1~~TRINITY_DN29751_c0_g1_i1.p1  ORF type:complete len:511 (+),score=54.01 TRINITY_DN29751_c0_g1_i1:32-1534(+)
MTSPTPLLSPERQDESVMSSWETHLANTWASMEDDTRLQSTDRNAGMALRRQNTISSLDAYFGHTESESEWAKDKWRAGQALICYCAVFASASFLENTFTLYAAALADAFGASDSGISFAFTVYIVSGACSGPFFASIGEYRGYRCVFTLCFVFICFAYTGFMLMDSVEKLYVSYVFGGLGIGCVWGPCIAGGIQLMPPSQQSYVAALMTMCYQCGSLCVSPFIEVVLRAHGFRRAYAMQGAITATCLGCVAFLLPEWENQRVMRVRGSLHAMRENDGDHDLIELEQLAASMPLAVVRTGMQKARFLALYFAYVLTATTYYLFEAEVQQIMAATLPTASLVRVTAVPTLLFVNCAMRPVWGCLASQRRATATMAAAFAVVAGCVVLWGKSAGSPALELVSASTGVGGACSMYVLMPVVIMRTYGHGRAAFLCALFNTADSIASVGGAPLVAWCSAQLGWPSTLQLFAVVPLAVVALLLPLMDAEVVPKQSSQNGSHRQAI